MCHVDLQHKFLTRRVDTQSILPPLATRHPRGALVSTLLPPLLQGANRGCRSGGGPPQHAGIGTSPRSPQRTDLRGVKAWRAVGEVRFAFRFVGVNVCAATASQKSPTIEVLSTWGEYPLTKLADALSLSQKKED